MDFLIALAALCFLMFVAYRGFSVILFAPDRRARRRLPHRPARRAGRLHQPLHGEDGRLRQALLPGFLLGAVFGKVIELSGFAKSIVHTIISVVGKEQAIMAIVLVCAVLTYGGVSLFVVVFAAYPFAAELFRAGNIPKRLIPGTIALGAFSFTMDSLPFSPQIQNIIPTTYFKTTTGAAPVLGIIGGIFIFVCGIAYLEWRKRARARQRGGLRRRPHQRAAADRHRRICLRPWIAFLPLIVVFGLNIALGGFPGVFNGLIDWAYGPTYDLKLAMDHAIPTPIPPIRAIWAVEGALLAGILVVFLFAFRAVSKTFAEGSKSGGRRRAACRDEHRFRIRLWRRHRLAARLPRHPRRARRHPQSAGPRGGHRHLARRHHRLGLGRHVDRAGGDVEGVHRHGERGAHPVGGVPPRRGDGERRHGHAAAQRRGDHAARRHRPHPPPVLSATSSPSPF